MSTAPTSTVRVASAPVSFGIFELTLDRTPLVEPDRLLDLVAGAGYEGVDLGPVGYLGDVRRLPARLSARSLRLAGGWVPLSFGDAGNLREELGCLEATLDLFVAAAGDRSDFAPKPTLADAGSAARRRTLTRPGPSRPGMDDKDWSRFAARVDEVAGRVRTRGLEPTFHHHAGTAVESPEEIDRLLALTDIGLCLDVGHLLVAGGDPVEAMSRWGDRINHLHVKDCRREVVDGIESEGAPVGEIWSRRAFCALGTGDLDLDGFLAAVRASAYSGWMVIEQDVFTRPGDTAESIAAEQAANLAELRRVGLP